MTTLFKLLQNAELLQKAKKAQTGQYAELPPWLLELGNIAESQPAAKRKQLEKYLLESGKLRPEDVKKLIDNRNIDVYHTLARRGDLSAEHALAMLSHPQPFVGVGGLIPPGHPELTDMYVRPDSYNWMSNAAARDERIKQERANMAQRGMSLGSSLRGVARTNQAKRHRELKDALLVKLNAAPNVLDDFVKNAPDRDLLAAMHLDAVPLTGERLLHAITERASMTPEIAKRIAEHPQFSSGHLTEIMNRPELSVKQAVMANARNLSNILLPQAVDRMLGDPEMRNSLVANAQVKLTPEQLRTALAATPTGTKHEDSDVRELLYSRILDLPNNEPGKNPLVRAAIDSATPQDAVAFYQDLDRYRYAANGRYQEHMPAEHAQALFAKLSALPRKQDLTPEQAGRARDEDTREGMLKDFVGGSLSRHLSPEAYQQTLLAMNTNVTPSRGYGYRETQGIESHATPEQVTPEFITSMLALPNAPEVKAAMYHRMHTIGAYSHHMNEGHARQIWAEASQWPATEAQHRRSVMGDLVGSSRTPPEVMSQVLSPAHVLNLDSDLQHSVLSNPSAPAEAWDKVAFESENKELRARAASRVESHTPERITRGLQDADPAVRRQWIKSATSLTPEQWQIVQSDRSPKNRAAAARRGDLPMDALKKFVTKDKAAAVNQVALNHASLTPELLDQAVKTMKPSTLLDVFHGNKLSAEQVKTLHKRIMDRHANMLTGAAESGGSSSLADSATGDDLTRLLRSTNMPADVLDQIVRHQSVRVDAEPVLASLASMPSATRDHWEALLKRAEASGSPSQYLKVLQAAPHADPARWTTLANKLGPADVEGYRTSPAFDAIATSLHVPDDTLINTIQRLGPKAAARITHLNETPRSQRVYEALYNMANQEGMPEERRAAERREIGALLLRHNALPSEMVSRIVQDVLSTPDYHRDYNSGNALSYALEHPNASSQIIRTLMSSPMESVKKKAISKMALVEPDSTSAQLGGHEVHTHPGVEKLKHLKGMVEAAGGAIAKKDLPNKGANIPGQLLDGKGMLTAQSIENAISGLQKERYMVTYSQWSGAQRHDRNVTQKVLQLNLTDAHLRALEEQGLMGSFRRLHKEGYTSAHPAQLHSLGWARIDDSHPDHWHIDEIQSDLGSRAIRRMEHIKSEMARGVQVSFDDQKYGEDLKKIIKVLAGPFKNINHAIFGATHQVARDQGIKTTSMDTLHDQARQSGMRTATNVSLAHLNSYYNGGSLSEDHKEALDRWVAANDAQGSAELGHEAWKEQFGDKNVAELPLAVPGFMQHTYKQMPDEAGYTEHPKKQAMPNTTGEEANVQFRKLVKSLTKLRELVMMLKELND